MQFINLEYCCSRPDFDTTHLLNKTIRGAALNNKTLLMGMYINDIVIEYAISLFYYNHAGSCVNSLFGLINKSFHDFNAVLLY